MMKIINLVLILLTSFLLTACSDSGTDSGSNDLNTATKIDANLSGVVVDGKISGANICLDINFNGRCDSNEPSTTTNISGYFNFGSYKVTNTTVVSYVVQDGVDIATGKNFVGSFKYIQTIDLNNLAYVTPLTDLMARDFFNQEVQNLEALNDSKTLISEAYDLGSIVMKNPLAYGGLFVRAQEIQQTKGIFEALVLKAENRVISFGERVEIREKIKSAMISSIRSNNIAFNAQDALSNLETLTGFTFLDNDKEFAEKQLANIKYALETFNRDDLNTSDPRFDIYQKKLEEQAQIAYNLINNSDANTTLTPFVLDIDVYLDDNTTNPPDTNSTQNDSNVSFSGYVMDGYLQGASVCIDLDYNGVCGSTEPKSITNSNGRFSFNDLNLSSTDANVSDDDIVYPIISKLGTDTFSQNSYKGELKSVIVVSKLNATNSTIISPLSDMVAFDFLAKGVKDKTSYSHSVSEIAQKFSLSDTEVLSDVTKDINLFLKSMFIEQIKRGVESTVIHTEEYSRSLEVLRNRIKQSLHDNLKDSGYEDLLMSNILNNVVNNLLLIGQISSQEENYFVNRLNELKILLTDLQGSTDVFSYTLPTLQTQVENKLNTVFADFNHSSIDLDVDEIVFSQFDKESALHDSIGCLVNDLYVNKLRDTNETSSANQDIANGMVIKATDRNVSVYYKNLATQIKTVSQIENMDLTTVYPNEYGFDSFAFDKSWVDGNNHVIYIQTAKNDDGKNSCYKVVLDSLYEGSIELEKVFRYTSK